MPYPPLFSSTLTYANRYDLDEIDVFLEGDSNNPMFFSVDGLPNQLSYGKHYFYLSILNSAMQIYQLRNQSKILFEFKSINNVVLKSDVVNVSQKNGVVQSEHKLKTTLGRFSFVDAHISSPKGVLSGQTMDSKGKPNISSTNITKIRSVF